MKTIKNSIIIWFAILVCSCTMDIDNDNTIPIFLMGQSNATKSLAKDISIVTGKKTDSINHPGQSIPKWFNDDTNYIEADKIYLNNRDVDYFVWFQGESDEVEDTENYELYFNRLLYEMGIGSDTIIIIVQIYIIGIDCEDMRQTQKNIADSMPNCYLIDSKDMTREGCIVHIDDNGKIMLAHKINELITSM